MAKNSAKRAASQDKLVLVLAAKRVLSWSSDAESNTSVESLALAKLKIACTGCTSTSDTQPPRVCLPSLDLHTFQPQYLLIRYLPSQLPELPLWLWRACCLWQSGLVIALVHDVNDYTLYNSLLCHRIMFLSRYVFVQWYNVLSIRYPSSINFYILLTQAYTVYKQASTSVALSMWYNE